MQKLRLDHRGFTAGGTTEGLAATRVIQMEYLAVMICFMREDINLHPIFLPISSKSQMFVLLVTIWWRRRVIYTANVLISVMRQAKLAIVQYNHHDLHRDITYVHKS
ncbi:hypothetical protein VPH35_118847 [Triticum aestivum]